jgi:hypothetical protein
LIVWLPTGAEPDDAGSWREVVTRALGGRQLGRVELQQCGDEWRVRIAVRFGGGAVEPRGAGGAWSDVTEEVTAALQSAGKPVLQLWSPGRDVARPAGVGGRRARRFASTVVADADGEVKVKPRDGRTRG